MTMISEPSVTVSKLPSATTQSTVAQRVLFVGGKTAAGTATSAVLQTEIDNSGEEDTLFGARSMLAGMIRAYKKINKATRIDAIGLTDATGVPAVGHVIFGTGPAGAATTIYVTIGSYENHRYTLPITLSQTVTQIGDALVALITADTDAPFTATNSAGDVSITMANDGTEGNQTGLYVEGTISAVTIGLTAFATGATNPTLTGVLTAAIGDARYQTMVAPYMWGSAFLKDFLDARWNVTNMIQDGMAVYAFNDTYANLVIAGNALNSQSMVLLGNKKCNDSDLKGPALLELDYAVAAEMAAIRALRLTTDEPISRYVVSSVGPLDAYGGPAIASLPYFNTPMYDLPLIPHGRGFTDTEVTGLKTAGVATLGNNTADNQCILGEIVTTYKTDSSGAADTTWKYLNYVDTASTVGEYFFNNLKSDYAQSRLTEGDLVAGRVLANEAKIRASMVKYYNILSGEDYVLVEAGDTALEFFKEELIVAIDKALGKVTITCKVPIVTQLRDIVVSMQVVFTTTAS